MVQQPGSRQRTDMAELAKRKKARADAERTGQADEGQADDSATAPPRTHTTRRVIRRTRSKNRPPLTAEIERSNYVKDHPRITLAVPHEAYRKLVELSQHLGVPLNTIGLQGVSLVFKHYHKESFETVTGEDPFTW